MRSPRCQPQRFAAQSLAAAFLAFVTAACGANSGGRQESSAASTNDSSGKDQFNVNNMRLALGVHPEVGVLFHHSPDGYVGSDCTGTLIQTPASRYRNVVLTAKHCHDMDTFYLGSGTAIDYPGDQNWQKVADKMQAYRVVATVELGNENVADGVCPHAVADQRLIFLERDVVGVEPVYLATTPPERGAYCEFVGFGRHLDADGVVRHLVKRSISIPVADVLANSIFQADTSAGTPGQGDSGGPLFCDDGVAATDSCGAGQVDLQSSQSFVRTDNEIERLDQLIASWRSYAHSP